MRESGEKGVNDGHKLAVMLVELLVHLLGVGESIRIPREVLLLVRVLDVEPDDVVGNVVLVKLAIDVHNVLVR